MSLEKMASNLGFELGENGVYYKNFGNYVGTLCSQRVGMMDFCLIFFPLNRVMTMKELGSIRKQVKSGGIPIGLYTLVVKNDCLIIQIPSKAKEKFIDKVIDVLFALPVALNNFNIGPRMTCPICGSTDVELGIFMNVYIPIHPECAEKFKTNTLESIANEEAKTNLIPLSILLAIIGAIIGAIPAFLSVFLFGYFIGYLYALVPIGSFFGYKLGKAPVKNYSTIIVIAISAIISIIATIANYSLIASLGYDKTLGEFLNTVKDGYYGFIMDIIITLVFIALGVFISWKYIANTLDKQKQRIDRM